MNLVLCDELKLDAVRFSVPSLTVMNCASVGFDLKLTSSKQIMSLSFGEETFPSDIKYKVENFIRSLCGFKHPLRGFATR
jgi:hypothetical protein